MPRFQRRILSAVLSTAIACGGLAIAAGPAGAAATVGSPSDLSVTLLSPQASDTTGADITYTSDSGWSSTNVVLTLPGWTALNPFASTGSAPCPASISLSAKPASGSAKASFSECTWTQSSSGAVLSVVVNSSSGLAGPVSIGLSQGMLKNPVAPAEYAVRLSEQSDAGWVTLSEWAFVDVPSVFTFDTTTHIAGALTSATASYVSASGWASTNVVLTLPGWIAQNTFSSTGNAPCPTSITVSATPRTATVSQCSWTQEGGSALFTAVVNSPTIGLFGPVTIEFGEGTLRNPLVPAQYVARLAEQSPAGWDSGDSVVDIGLPHDLRAALRSYDQGATTGADITYDSASSWAGTNVTLVFPGFTAFKTFESTGSRPCPSTVRVVATPSSATTSQCSWTAGRNPQLSFVLNSPGYGLQGAVRVVLATGLLGNPDNAGPAAIRLAEQSGAGWVGLGTTVTLNPS
jgi:hypothetical protein